MTSLLVTFLLFFLQFVVFPVGISPFESPKVLLSEVVLVLLVCLTIVGYKGTWQTWKRDVTAYILKNRVQSIGYGGLVIMLLLSVAFHPTQIVFLGNAYRLQGIFLYGLVFLFASMNFPIKHLSWKVLLALLTVQLVAALVVVGRTDLRAIGTLGEPNALAASALFLWPWIWFGVEKQKTKILLQLMVLFLVASILFLSQSLSGALGFLLQIVILFIPRFLSLKNTILLAGVFILCLHMTPFFDRSSLYENRGQIWIMALQTGAKHPIIGNGIGNIQSSLNQIQKENGGYMKYISVDSSHNVFLDFWVMGGLVGLLSVLLILIFSVKKYTKQNDIRSLVLLFGILVSMCFNPVSVVTLIQFWWLVRLNSKENLISA